MDRRILILALALAVAAGKHGTVRVGDMVLSKDQYDILFGDDEGPRHKRKAVEDLSLRWTNGVIPYEFYRDDFSDYQKKDARVAFDFYEQETCLKFRPATPDDVNKTVIRQGWGGCNSELGMVGGAQNVNLDNNGCRWFGLYLHEFGHAIGLVHEHQLPDRDEHLEVLWNNVQPVMRQWFKKYKNHELRRHGVPYDLASVMHYELNAFSKLNMRAIKVRDDKKHDWIGRVYWKTLSFSDVKLVNLMYNCNSHCPKNIPCPEEGFINKECKCVTPKEYFDHVCVNDQGDEQCNTWAVQGECGGNPGWMNINCRRACNACPRFLVDEHVKKEGDCYNNHVDDKLCETWVSKGFCEEYPSTVKRWCRKSCNACDWKRGRCPNFNGNDKACDDWAAMGECEANPLHMKPQCADSCDTCDWKPRGKCENKAGDEVCAKKEDEGLCHKMDAWMMENCASTCDTCDFNAGNCENEAGEKECTEGYLEGGCEQDPRYMKKKCAKTCNSCGWGVKGNCKDRFPIAAHCDNWAVYGSCDVNPGWMGLFCASSCNTCDYPAIVAEECINSNGRDEDCKGWARAGECDSNPEYMRMNCQKACKTCSYMKPNACFDLYPESQCQAMKAKGDCESNADWMLKGCTKTCNRCYTADEGPVEAVTEKPEITEETDGDCRDEYHDCAENKAKGWCTTVSWMKTGCKKTCDLCGETQGKEDHDEDEDDNDEEESEEEEEEESEDSDCRDEYHDCAENKAKGWCSTVSWMKTGCRKTCGLCQSSGAGGEEGGKEESEKGGEEKQGEEEEESSESGDCIDEYDECPAWAHAGHCFVDSVQAACRKSCRLCRK